MAVITPKQKPRIQTVQLKAEEQPKEAKKELEDVAVITGIDDMYQVFLNRKERNLNAPTFRAYPLRGIEWDQVDHGWKETLRVFCSGCTR
jgi:hypothetical protein